jgi:hypothetical protein
MFVSTTLSGISADDRFGDVRHHLRGLIAVVAVVAPSAAGAAAGRLSACHASARSRFAPLLVPVLRSVQLRRRA